MKRIAIIDYGSGNLRSAAKALEHVANGHEVRVTSDAVHLASATHIVLPGVGAFKDCMAGLTAIPGMRDRLEEEVRMKQKPFLGICVGMQLLATKGFEHGEHAGLGWIEGEVRPIPSKNLKIPHMGWNDLHVLKAHPLLSGIEPGAHAYFLHSYHVAAQQNDIVATVDYGEALVALLAKDNIMGAQFHPEKSQQTGLKLLENFLSL